MPIKGTIRTCFSLLIMSTSKRKSLAASVDNVDSLMATCWPLGRNPLYTWLLPPFPIKFSVNSKDLAKINLFQHLHKKSLNKRDRLWKENWPEENWLVAVHRSSYRNQLELEELVSKMYFNSLANSFCGSLDGEDRFGRFITHWTTDNFRASASLGVSKFDNAFLSKGQPSLFSGNFFTKTATELEALLEASSRITRWRSLGTSPCMLTPSPDLRFELGMITFGSMPTLGCNTLSRTGFGSLPNRKGTSN